MKKWEIAIENKRGEFKKSLPQLEERKKELIRLKLSEFPLMSLEDLDRNLKESGLIGLSLKERVEVVRSQIALQVTKFKHISGKINRFFIYFFKKIKKIAIFVFFSIFKRNIFNLLFPSGESEEKRTKRTRKMKVLEDQIRDFNQQLESLRTNYKSMYRDENI